MRSSMIIDMILGFALQFFRSQGNESAVAYVTEAIEVKRRTGNVDSYMEDLRDRMLAGWEEPNFDDLIGRINKEVDELAERAEQPDPPTDVGTEEPDDKTTEPE